MEKDHTFPQRAAKPADFTPNPTTEATHRAAGPNFFRDASFTADIFRVKIAGSEATLAALTDEPEFPPPEANMLVGTAKEVRVGFDEADNLVSLSSPSIKLVVELRLFRLKAFKKGSATPRLYTFPVKIKPPKTSLERPVSLSASCQLPSYSDSVNFLAISYLDRAFMSIF
ncbi:hypothetical protein LTR86_011167 [Recurvomyces mirabilis]|nr:hypothetical protein LTR86_011167 [Recurvomyces mirabilis]